MKVEFKKLNEMAVIPQKAHPTDAGFDMTCSGVDTDVRGIITYHTGIATAIPDGYVGLLFSRSSIYKQDLILSNSVGVIDSSYRGEIMFKFRTTQPYAKCYSVGDKIGQIIIIPYPEIEFVEADTLPESDRGEGGFGSSGK